MKKNFINYYSIIILLFYVLYNCILSTIKIGGLLYQIFMITIIIVNIITLLKLNKQIKFKKTCFIVFFITFIFGKNIFQMLFCLSSIITIYILEYSSKGIFFKIISTIISILLILVFHFYFLILGRPILKNKIYKLSLLSNFLIIKMNLKHQLESHYPYQDMNL